MDFVTGGAAQEISDARPEPGMTNIAVGAGHNMRGAPTMAPVAERGLREGLVQQPRFVWGEDSQPQTVPAAPRAKARAERR